MPTAHIPKDVRDYIVNNFNMSGRGSPCMAPPTQTDRHDWKHYFPATSLVGVKIVH